MAKDDLSLHDLIVRALTGGDSAARRSLDVVASTDPELHEFCSELEQVVRTIVGAREWRVQGPSVDLTARIRDAVIAKLPTAPPHFRRVLIEADLGRHRTKNFVMAGCALVVLLLVAGVLWWTLNRGVHTELNLKGETAWQVGELTSDIGVVGSGQWQWGKEGLKLTGSDPAGALFFKNGFPTDQALAFNLDVTMAGLEDRSHVILFLAYSSDGTSTAFVHGSRPEKSIQLELTKESAILYDMDQGLLKSGSLNPSFNRIRMEYLGSKFRVYVNSALLYGVDLPRTPSGFLHPGILVRGPEKGRFLFNRLKIER